MTSNKKVLKKIFNSVFTHKKNHEFLYEHYVKSTWSPREGVAQTYAYREGWRGWGQDNGAGIP